MGRFDALTQIEEKQENKTPKQEVSSPTIKNQIAQSEKEEKEIKKPASPQAGKTANPFTRKPASPLIERGILEKPEKYTTRLTPSLVKKVRLYAIDKDMKDYEVVSTALNQYLERNK